MRWRRSSWRLETRSCLSGTFRARRASAAATLTTRSSSRHGAFSLLDFSPHVPGAELPGACGIGCVVNFLGLRFCVQVLGWAPGTSLREGLGYTYAWIKDQVDNFQAQGGSLDQLTSSKVVGQTMADKCDMGSKTSA
eukprot:4651564-Pleurochrysis_carterae.AAC.7